MKRIVIATDGSPQSAEAVDVGLELAAAEGAEVTFVHVVPPDKFVGGRGMMQPLPHRVPIDETEEALTEAARAAEEAGVSYSEERISGLPVDEILAVADTKDADLIVVGSSGRGAVAAALLGSVSREVVSRSKRPVLVVKGAPVAAKA